MNADIFKGRRSVPEYLVGMILFVLDLAVDLLIGAILGIGLLWKQFVAWIREDRKNLWALYAGPFIAYFAIGTFRLIGVAFGSPGLITYSPWIDGWWAYPIQFLNWALHS